MEIVQNGGVLLDRERNLALRLVGVDVEEVRKKRPKQHGMMRLLDNRNDMLCALQHRLPLDRSRHRQQQEEAELASHSTPTPTRRMEPTQFPSFNPCVNACATIVTTSETKS